MYGAGYDKQDIRQNTPLVHNESVLGSDIYIKWKVHGRNYLLCVHKKPFGDGHAKYI